MNDPPVGEGSRERADATETPTFNWRTYMRKDGFSTAAPDMFFVNTPVPPVNHFAKDDLLASMHEGSKDLWCLSQVSLVYKAWILVRHCGSDHKRWYICDDPKLRPIALSDDKNKMAIHRRDLTCPSNPRFLHSAFTRFRDKLIDSGKNVASLECFKPNQTKLELGDFQTGMWLEAVDTSQLDSVTVMPARITERRERWEKGKKIIECVVKFDNWDESRSFTIYSGSERLRTIFRCGWAERANVEVSLASQPFTGNRTEKQMRQSEDLKRTGSPSQNVTNTNTRVIKKRNAMEPPEQEVFGTDGTPQVQSRKNKRIAHNPPLLSFSPLSSTSGDTVQTRKTQQGSSREMSAVRSSHDSGGVDDSQPSEPPVQRLAHASVSGQVASSKTSVTSEKEPNDMVQKTVVRRSHTLASHDGARRPPVAIPVSKAKTIPRRTSNVINKTIASYGSARTTPFEFTGIRNAVSSNIPNATCPSKTTDSMLSYSLPRGSDEYEERTIPEKSQTTAPNDPLESNADEKERVSSSEIDDTNISKAANSELKERNMLSSNNVTSDFGNSVPSRLQKIWMEEMGPDRPDKPAVKCKKSLQRMSRPLQRNRLSLGSNIHLVLSHSPHEGTSSTPQSPTSTQDSCDSAGRKVDEPAEQTECRDSQETNKDFDPTTEKNIQDETVPDIDHSQLPSTSTSESSTSTKTVFYPVHTPLRDVVQPKKWRTKYRDMAERALREMESSSGGESTSNPSSSAPTPTLTPTETHDSLIGDGTRIQNETEKSTHELNSKYRSSELMPDSVLKTGERVDSASFTVLPKPSSIISSASPMRITVQRVDDLSQTRGAVKLLPNTSMQLHEAATASKKQDAKRPGSDSEPGSTSRPPPKLVRVTAFEEVDGTGVLRATIPVRSQEREMPYPLHQPTHNNWQYDRYNFMQNEELGDVGYEPDDEEVSGPPMLDGSPRMELVPRPTTRAQPEPYVMMLSPSGFLTAVALQDIQIHLRADWRFAHVEYNQREIEGNQQILEPMVKVHGAMEQQVPPMGYQMEPHQEDQMCSMGLNEMPQVIRNERELEDELSANDTVQLNLDQSDMREDTTEPLQEGHDQPSTSDTHQNLTLQSGHNQGPNAQGEQTPRPQKHNDRNRSPNSTLSRSPPSDTPSSAAEMEDIFAETTPLRRFGSQEIPVRDSELPISSSRDCDARAVSSQDSDTHTPVVRIKTEPEPEPDLDVIVVDRASTPTPEMKYDVRTDSTVTIYVNKSCETGRRLDWRKVTDLPSTYMIKDELFVFKSILQSFVNAARNAQDWILPEWKVERREGANRSVHVTLTVNDSSTYQHLSIPKFNKKGNLILLLRNLMKKNGVCSNFLSAKPIENCTLCHKYPVIEKSWNKDEVLYWANKIAIQEGYDQKSTDMIKRVLDENDVDGHVVFLVLGDLSDMADRCRLNYGESKKLQSIFDHLQAKKQVEKEEEIRNQSDG